MRESKGAEAVHHGKAKRQRISKGGLILSSYPVTNLAPDIWNLLRFWTTKLHMNNASHLQPLIFVSELWNAAHITGWLPNSWIIIPWGTLLKSSKGMKWDLKYKVYVHLFYLIFLYNVELWQYLNQTQTLYKRHWNLAHELGIKIFKVHKNCWKFFFFTDTKKYRKLRQHDFTVQALQDTAAVILKPFGNVVA